VLLTGGTAVIPHVDTFLNEKLGVEVEYLNPFQQVFVGSAISPEMVAADAHMLSETVGLALRSTENSKVELDLMPAEILAGKEFEKKTPFFIVSAIFFVITMALWAVYMYGKAIDAEELLRVATSKEQKLRGIGSDINGMTDAIKAEEAVLNEITTLLDERKQLVVVTKALRDTIPPGLWVSTFSTEIPPAPRVSSARNQDDPDAEPPPPPPPRFELKGLGYKDLVNGQTIKDLANAIKEKEAFQDAEVVQLPQDKREDLQSYWISATLKDQLPK
jgi:hypothetical protein